MSVLNASIDLTKIDKSKIIVGKKGGQYINLAVIETPTNEYSSHMIVLSTTKEEREKGVRGEIIGSVKKWDNEGSNPQSKATPAVEDSSSLPF